LGGCPTGEAKASKGYRLPAKWVIHTVGPVWHGGTRNENRLLANCYRNSFKVAEDLGVKTIAFPSISTGVYRFPLERATQIAMTETKRFLERNDTLEEVRFVCFGGDAKKTYDSVLSQVF
jgi:O-acetyl-ADP-ribose deacetylase (regulator of RNase III)